MAYSKNYKRINPASRTVLVKGADQFGGQILSVKVASREIFDLGLGESYPEETAEVSAEITSSNGNGEGGRVILTFQANRNNGGFYSDWSLVAGSGEFRLDGGKTENNGSYFYSVGETFEIDMTQFSSNNEGLSIEGAVTSIYPDRNYGYQTNHQILYDRFDRKCYFRIENLDGTVDNIDFFNQPYTPSELPDDTYFIEFVRISSNQLEFKYSNAPLTITLVEEHNGLVEIDSTEIFQDSIIVTTVEDLEYGVDYQFHLTFTDILGEEIVDSVNLNLADPGGTGDDFAPLYEVWTGTPYFLDEAYHMVVYTADELASLGLRGDTTISRIGLPLHLVSGQGGNVTDEEVQSGFVAAARILTYVGDTVENGYILELLDDNDDLDPNILNVDVSKKQGIVETINGQRWVFFQLNNYVWNGTDNILVLYWMDGGNPSNGGFNGGYINTEASGSEEVLGFSKQNNWTGVDGITGEKAAIAFTTLRG